MSDAIRVVVIEDHVDYRESVCDAVRIHPGYEIGGSFSTMEDALDAFAGGSVAEIILVDLGLPGMDGITGIESIRVVLPTARVIVLTAYRDQEKVFAALRSGAHGYLLKSASVNRLVETLEEVSNGGTPLDSQIAGMVLGAFNKISPIISEESLSARECQILELVSQGHTKQSAAFELGISTHSVSEYIRRSFEKLHVHSLPAAVSAAIRRGLLDLSELDQRE
ncbi:MAG: response regulator transcription factor [Verrucomicrobiota bacterium]